MNAKSRSDLLPRYFASSASLRTPGEGRGKGFSRGKNFNPVSVSLRDLLGDEYLEGVAEAQAALGGRSAEQAKSIADHAVELLPEKFQQRQVALLESVGRQIIKPIHHSAQGATTERFTAASRRPMAPLSCLGMYRVGEDGRLRLITKSEHYHVPLGHGFPGWRLVDHARQLGICSATHNNTRGHITRLLEQRLIAAANGTPSSVEADDLAPAADDPNAIKRVLNLETGSIALEAAIKLVLAQFYRYQPESPAPPFAGRTPVLLVIGNEQGEGIANYHGTTIFAQMMRGLWPDFRQGFDARGLARMRAVRVNSVEDLERAFATSDAATEKIAAFFLELVLMNYGALKLQPRFVARMAELCRQHDVPMIVDEIQTGLWSPKLFMYHEYGLRPAMVGLGKGFPGGEYAASRLLFASKFDTLPQFGVLVTNGQEELASLVYLIGMRWVSANADMIESIGEYYEQRVRELASHHPGKITAVDGRRHLLGIHFASLDPAREFVRGCEAGGLDVSVQTYKSSVPPVALTKLPLIAGYEAVDLVIKRFDAALRAETECPGA